MIFALVLFSFATLAVLKKDEFSLKVVLSKFQNAPMSAIKEPVGVEEKILASSKQSPASVPSAPAPASKLPQAVTPKKATATDAPANEAPSAKAGSPASPVPPQPH